MLYTITAKLPVKEYKDAYSYHRFIAHATNMKQLKAYFKASKPKYTLVEVIEKDSNIMEIL